jgi:hypothetical protein
MFRVPAAKIQCLNVLRIVALSFARKPEVVSSTFTGIMAGDITPPLQHHRKENPGSKPKEIGE